MENLGLTKNLLYGSLLGLISSAILLYILNNVLFPDYIYTRDVMKQTYEGGALTLVSIVFVVVGLLKPKEISEMSFGMGILVLFGFLFTGYFIPIFVLGALAVVFWLRPLRLIFIILFLRSLGLFALAVWALALLLVRTISRIRSILNKAINKAV